MKLGDFFFLLTKGGIMGVTFVCTVAHLEGFGVWFNALQSMS